MRTGQRQPDLQAAFTDHDRLFKELLTVFFTDFIELFLPEVAQYLDGRSVSFLNTELFYDVARSQKHVVDILARARFRGQSTQFLLHIENQSRRQAGFAERMYLYSAEITLQHKLPVYPIAMLTYDRPQTVEPNEYRVTFPDFAPLHFRFRTIQLDRLNWRDFLNRRNPVAAALMAKMKIAPSDRPKVKSECLRLLATLKLDPARTQLIAGFVDSYLTLSEREMRQFEREIAALPREEQEAIVPLTISWKEEGRNEGRVEGLNEGLTMGRVEGLNDGLTMGRVDEARRLLTLFGVGAFGEVTAEVREAIDRIESIEELERLALQMPRAKTWDELLARD